jgi:hypothetical protein
MFQSWLLHSHPGLVLKPHKVSPSDMLCQSQFLIGTRLRDACSPQCRGEESKLLMLRSGYATLFLSSAWECLWGAMAFYIYGYVWTGGLWQVSSPNECVCHPSASIWPRLYQPTTPQQLELSERVLLFFSSRLANKAVNVQLCLVYFSHGVMSPLLVS